jgi:hypothetical protein
VPAKVSPFQGLSTQVSPFDCPCPAATQEEVDWGETFLRVHPGNETVH